MTQVYNMGAVVEECEVIMEFKRSGREGSVLPTDICNMQQVQDVSSEYQECIEAANEDMSTNIVKQKTVDNILTYFAQEWIRLYMNVLISWNDVTKTRK